MFGQISRRVARRSPARIAGGVLVLGLAAALAGCATLDEGAAAQALTPYQAGQNIAVAREAAERAENAGRLVESRGDCPAAAEENLAGRVSEQRGYAQEHARQAEEAYASLQYALNALGEMEAVAERLREATNRLLSARAELTELMNKAWDEQGNLARFTRYIDAAKEVADEVGQSVEDIADIMGELRAAYPAFSRYDETYSLAEMGDIVAAWEAEARRVPVQVADGRRAMEEAKSAVFDREMRGIPINFTGYSDAMDRARAAVFGLGRESGDFLTGMFFTGLSREGDPSHGWLRSMIETARAEISESASSLASHTRSAQDAAYEAQQLALTALRACGEAVPEFPRRPGWGDTFWDISSP